MARATYSFCRLHARHAFRVKTVSTRCLQCVAVPRFYLTVQAIDSRCKQKQNKKRIMEKGETDERGLVTRKDGRGCLLNKTHGGSSRVFTPHPPTHPHTHTQMGDRERYTETETARTVSCFLLLFFLSFFFTLYSLNSFRLGKQKTSMQMWWIFSDLHTTMTYVSSLLPEESHHPNSSDSPLVEGILSCCLFMTANIHHYYRLPTSTTTIVSTRLLLYV